MEHTKDQAANSGAFNALLGQLTEANIKIANQASDIAALQFDLKESEKQREALRTQLSALQAQASKKETKTTTRKAA